MRRNYAYLVAVVLALSGSIGLVETTLSFQDVDKNSVRENPLVLDRAKRVTSSGISSLAVSADGKTLAAGTENGHLLLVDPKDLSVICSLDNGVVDQEFLADGSLCCACREHVSVLRIVNASLEETNSFEIKGTPLDVIPGGDGTLFIITTSCLYRYNGSLECVLERRLMGFAPDLRNNVWWLGGVGEISGVAAGKVNEPVFQVELAIRQADGPWLPDRVTGFFAFKGQRRMLVVRKNRVESLVEIYGLDSHKAEQRVYYGPNYFRDFAEVGNYLISSGTELVVWDLISLQPILTIRQPEKYSRPQPSFFTCSQLTKTSGRQELVVGTVEGTLNVYTIN